MKTVRAKYYKEVEVTDNVSDKEIEKIDMYGMPDRFDGMADQIDNEKPLEFVSWDYVKNDVIDEQEEVSIYNVVKTTLYNLLPAIICAIIFSIGFGVSYKDIKVALSFFVFYWIIWYPVIEISKWIDKVNKVIQEKED